MIECNGLLRMVVHVPALSELSDEDFADTVANDLKRRAAERAQAVPVAAVENLVGPDKIVEALHLPNRRALYRLGKNHEERTGKPLPFDRSRNQKDRVYDLTGAVKWASRRNAA